LSSRVDLAFIHWPRRGKKIEGIWPDMFIRPDPKFEGGGLVRRRGGQIKLGPKERLRPFRPKGGLVGRPALRARFDSTSAAPGRAAAVACLRNSRPLCNKGAPTIRIRVKGQGCSPTPRDRKRKAADFSYLGTVHSSRIFLENVNQAHRQGFRGIGSHVACGLGSVLVTGFA